MVLSTERAEGRDASRARKHGHFVAWAHRIFRGFRRGIRIVLFGLNVLDSVCGVRALSIVPVRSESTCPFSVSTEAFRSSFSKQVEPEEGISVTGGGSGPGRPSLVGADRAGAADSEGLTPQDRVF